MIRTASRIEQLMDHLYDHDPIVESERALLVTESYQQTENQPMIIRRAKALENILGKMKVVIRPNELIVGNLATSPRGTQIFPEFSNDWLEDEFDRIEKRAGDKFIVPEQVKQDLSEAFKYWKGRTTNELATELMSPETKNAMNAGVFTVGNYYFNGVGHISVDYKLVLEKGLKGIKEEVCTALKSLDYGDPEIVKKSLTLKAMSISLDAVMNYARRLADEAKLEADRETDSNRKSELLQIAANCARVPANPATSFYEALQSFWIIQAVIQIESNGHSISPMRFDQYMYPFYKKDVENGRLDEAEAQKLLDVLWVKFNDVNKIRDEASTKAFGGYPMFQNLIVGGQDKEGMDATNPLSYACLQATANTRLPQPSISIRIWNKTPESLIHKAGEVSRLGLGMPAYYSDEVIIPSLVNRGISLTDARDYGIIGCVEPQVGGKTEGWHDAAFFNIPKVLEITLNNGYANGEKIGLSTGDFSSFTTFDQLKSAFEEQMKYFVKLLVNADNSVDVAHGERAPLPFLSSMVEGCIEKGLSLQEGGAKYNFTGPQGVGIANAGDALMAIKKLIYEDNKLSIHELKNALDTNFGKEQNQAITNSEPVGTNKDLSQLSTDELVEMLKDLLNDNDTNIKKKDTNASQSMNEKDGEYIRQLLINGAPKYGNDIDVVDQMVRKVALIYCKEVQKYLNPRGGTFQPGLYPVSANVSCGLETKASADGRFAGEPLADGVSPVSGSDQNGPTAALNSVAKLDHHIASNGTLLNQKFHPSALAGKEGLRNLSALVRSYFEQKGMHVQFNVVSKETLLDAQKNPEKYKNLVVRVAGYSAHFVSLDKSIQQDIIARTEQQF
ncbi:MULTISPECIES: glycyl radical protein [Clostridia]|uniref:glycyl radical protein n=1 Tax=Clostridia TaxID=186801 RepID=UPI000EA002B2|nr:MULTISPECIES: glycyl radical protein [Clostridia]NBJ68045.1 glycyl radical protein [Roseburia sp. 1XD42-34]RKI82486.1 glycyl radical protein [Clostridium sp. 1xD42-85]